MKGQFDDGEKIYLQVQEGFKKHYEKGTVVESRRQISGLKQAAFSFCKESLPVFDSKWVLN